MPTGNLTCGVHILGAIQCGDFSTRALFGRAVSRLLTRRSRLRTMGLLAVEVSAFGVVMSADSQPVELLDGETRVLAQAGQRRTRNPILIRDGGGFTGFTGYVGTEAIANGTTRDWLTTFGGSYPNENLTAYANALGEALTEEWKRKELSSILEILISVSRTARFVLVRQKQPGFARPRLDVQAGERRVSCGERPRR
jgi:hypothetical protein